MNAKGEVLIEIDEARTRADLEAAYAEGFRSVAIVFMHGWRYSAHEARAAALARAIGFPQVSVSHELSPLMSMHTVAAGGGSIRHFDGARYRVGPDSAGANPGPACYRRDGPLTVTDCNVMLGKIQADFFPAVFGPGGDQPLDVRGVREK